MSSRTPSHRAVALLCAALMVMPVASSALAETGAQSFRGSAQRDRKQTCNTTFTVEPDGTWTARTRFSNRRRVDSDWFEAVFRLVDETGEVSVAVKHGAFVRARYRRGPHTVTVTSRGVLDTLALPIERHHVWYRCTDRGGVPDRDVVGTLVRIIDLL